MTRQLITTAQAPSSPLHSQGVRAGSAIYVAGMVGVDAETGSSRAPRSRSRRGRPCAPARGRRGGWGGPDHLAQVTVLRPDPADFAGMNEAYAKVLALDPPARAVVRLGVQLPDTFVSIMMTAHVGSDRTARYRGPRGDGGGAGPGDGPHRQAEVFALGLGDLGGEPLLDL